MCVAYADYDNVTWTEEDYEIEAKMAQYWVNFISTGNPNGNSGSNLTEFVASTPEKTQTMWLGESWGASYLAESEEKIKFITSWLSTLYEY